MNSVTVTESREQLEKMLTEIARWENDQMGSSLLDRIGRLPFLVLDKLTPKAVRDKIGQILDEIGGFVQNGGKYLISERGMLRKLAAERHRQRTETGAGLGVPSSEGTLRMGEVRSLPLSVMDRTAGALASSRSNAAMVQGATTGFGGFATLAIDIPAVLALSLKVIQETAICYGYDPQLKEERVFAVKVLQFASSDAVGRKAVLDSLSAVVREGSVGELQGWREVVAAYRDRFGWKKLFQAVPVAGMVFGAVINKGTLAEVAHTAQMLYRKRRILERMQE